MARGDWNPLKRVILSIAQGVSLGYPYKINSRNPAGWRGGRLVSRAPCCNYTRGLSATHSELGVPIFISDGSQGLRPGLMKVPPCRAFPFTGHSTIYEVGSQASPWLAEIGSHEVGGRGKAGVSPRSGRPVSA